MRHDLDDWAALLAPGAWLLFARTGPASVGYAVIGLVAILIGLALTAPKRRPDPGADPAGASGPAQEGSVPQTRTPL